MTQWCPHFNNYWRRILPNMSAYQQFHDEHLNNKKWNECLVFLIYSPLILCFSFYRRFFLPSFLLINVQSVRLGFIFSNFHTSLNIVFFFFFFEFVPCILHYQLTFLQPREICAILYHRRLFLLHIPHFFISKPIIHVVFSACFYVCLLIIVILFFTVLDSSLQNVFLADSLSLFMSTYV